MGDSAWGDIFDVLTASAPQEALNAYKVLVLLGQMNMKDGMKERLRAFVDNGGTLVWCAGQATPEDAAFCGAAIQPELRVGRAWRWGAGEPVAEAFRYCPVAETKDGVEVLAATPAGDPLVLRRRVGTGAVVTVLVPWYEAGHAPLCGLARRAFDEVFGGVQPVRVKGLPVQWLSTTGPTHRTVLVSNNDGAPWTGEVIVSGVAPALAKCRELTAGTEVPFTRNGETASATVSVAPYSVAGLRWAE